MPAHIPFKTKLEPLLRNSIWAKKPSCSDLQYISIFFEPNDQSFMAIIYVLFFVREKL